MVPPRGRRTRSPGKHLDHIAKRLDATAAQVALAWVPARSRVTLPIPGTGKVSHLEENVAAANVALTTEDFQQLDDLGRAEWNRSKT